MFAIQPEELVQGDEKLGTVAVRVHSGHAHPSNAVVFQLEVLITKWLTINALSCGGQSKEKR
jgi:hypothetical protein